MGIAATFLRGLGVLVPVALTVWFAVWVATGTEALLRNVFLFFIPERFYLPGLGFALGLALIYATGVLVQVFIIRQLWEALERLLERIPLVKTVYTALSDFLGFFSKDSKSGSKVVSVDMGDGASLIGVVTDDNPQALTAPGDPEDRVAVYLPMSYQVGGYTLLVPRTRIRPLELGVEQAMRLIMTAGIQRK